jgi:hypothetical protein
MMASRPPEEPLGKERDMSLAVDSICPAPELDELESHLQSFLSGRISGLQLVPQGDGVVLRGRTRTYYAKQLAQQALMKATPMPIVANEIQVV